MNATIWVNSQEIAMELELTCKVEEYRADSMCSSVPVTQKYLCVEDIQITGIVAILLIGPAIRGYDPKTHRGPVSESDKDVRLPVLEQTASLLRIADAILETDKNRAIGQILEQYQETQNA